MASRCMISLASRACISRQPCLFVRQSRQPGQLVLPLALGPRSYSGDSRSTEDTPLPKWTPSRKAFGAAIVTGGFAFIGFITRSVWQDWYQEYRQHSNQLARERAVFNMIETGTELNTHIDHPIPREDVIKSVLRVITPTSHSRMYPLIIGEHGTGKTSSISLALERLEYPKGVIYVNNPVDGDSPMAFIQAMQRALGWNPDPVTNSNISLSLQEVWDVFSNAAIKYRQQHGKIPVLIIDNLNKLAENQPKLLDHLQDYAKLASDEGTATLVFVSSEGGVPLRMMERCSWSRHGDILEIGDMSKEEAFDYLNLRGVHGEQAAQIYELVGGRISQLKRVADDMEGNQPLGEVWESRFNDASSQVAIAKMDPKGEFHKDGIKVMQALLREGCISHKAYRELVGYEVGNKLLEGNVFAYHFNPRQITFQSTLMRRLCEQEVAVWSEGGSKGILKFFDD